MPQSSTQRHIRVIYNPEAGRKRRFWEPFRRHYLEDLQKLFSQYELSADFVPTQNPGHATRLARQSVALGYKIVVAAGGDGTVSEVASGLLGSSVILGILPLGSFMNIARMLSIPRDLEKAVMLLKIGPIHSIDAGSITELKSGQRFYFFENSGFGLEAQFYYWSLEFENRPLFGLFRLFRIFIRYRSHRVILDIDGHRFQARPTLISVSNGPYTGAALRWSPDARLNDHLLTVRVNTMPPLRLVLYFFSLVTGRTSRKPFGIREYQGTEVRLLTRQPRPLHADGRFFIKTPVLFQILPNAVSVITGFPADLSESALVRRTRLRP